MFQVLTELGVVSKLPIVIYKCNYMNRYQPVDPEQE